MISGMLWSSNDSGFLILVNSYVIHDTEMDANEAAFGVTVTGEEIHLIFLAFCSKHANNLLLLSKYFYRKSINLGFLRFIFVIQLKLIIH